MDWLEEYDTGFEMIRKQKVAVNGRISSCEGVSKRVSRDQFKSQGRLLFIVYISDLDRG